MEQTARPTEARSHIDAAPHVDPPMQSPAPFLAALAAFAILLLGGLMATDFIWTAQHPVTVAHTSSSTAAPVTTAPATKAPG